MSLKLSRLSGALAAGSIAFTLAMPGIAAAQDTHGTAVGSLAEVSNAQVQSLLASVGDTVNFTIHKYNGEPQTKDRLTGTTADAPDTNGLEPVGGVEFSVAPVEGFDLNKVSDWKRYSEVDTTKTPQEQGLSLGKATTLTTGDNGEVSKEMPVGVYYVTETKTPAGASAIAPFFVALPLPDNTDPNGTGSEGWVDDVHVYPKNQPISVEKSVVDKDVVAGETIEYSIAGNVPAVPQNKKFNGYDIVDDYDESRVTPVLDTVKVSFSSGDQLTKGTDYTIVESDGQFAVSFTEAGLVKLAEKRAGNPDLEVNVVFNAEVKADVENGEAINKASVYPPNTGSPSGDFRGEFDPEDPPEDPVPSNEVKTVMGRISINKTDAKNGESLSGAEFQLYKCGQGTTDTQSGPLTINGQDKWITDDEGKVTLPAVQVEDFYNNEQQTDEFDYCLVESKAPSGYALNPKPVSASVTAGTTLASVDITNAPEEGMFRLPSTGAAGVIGLLAGGLSLAIFAVFAIRRNNQQA